jgi:hypothetical protein
MAVCFAVVCFAVEKLGVAIAYVESNGTTWTWINGILNF